MQPDPTPYFGSRLRSWWPPNLGQMATRMRIPTLQISTRFIFWWWLYILFLFFIWCSRQSIVIIYIRKLLWRSPTYRLLLYKPKKYIYKYSVPWAGPTVADLSCHWLLRALSSWTFQTMCPCNMWILWWWWWPHSFLLYEWTFTELCMRWER